MYVNDMTTSSVFVLRIDIWGVSLRSCPYIYRILAWHCTLPMMP
jgi:hypothetical protein